MMDHLHQQNETTNTTTTTQTQQPTMKRQRPWQYNNKKRLAATATVLMGLCCGSSSPIITPCMAIPLFSEGDYDGALFLEEEEELQRQGSSIEPAPETDVTPYPSPVPTTTPATKPPSSLQLAVFEKSSLPINLDMILNVTTTVDLNNLIQDVQDLMETYLLDGLMETFQNDNGLNVRGVSLVVTSLAQRRRQQRSWLRQLQSVETKDVTLQVDGSVQYDSSSSPEEDNADLIGSQLETLLDVDNLNQAIAQADIEGVVALDQATLVDPRQVPTTPPNQATTAPTLPTGGANGVQSSNTTNNELERPSTLSIVFGFVLTAIAAAGLVAYAYIFYRKRRKRLRRQKQMKESIQYRLPNKLSPTKRSQQPQQQPQTTQLVSTASAKESEEDSDDESSYKGIHSLASGEETADSFARDLQMAASLDQQAWESFQRKKDTLDRNGVLLSSNNNNNSNGAMQSSPRDPRSPDESINKYGGSSQWAKSFPYGDEEQDVMEEWVEWTAEDSVDDVSNWEPYIKTEEKKEDSFGLSNSFAARDTSRESASKATAAALQALERDLSLYGSHSNDNDNADSSTLDNNTSEIVSEVERLSRFVMRYEKRKERRLQREYDRNSRSSDSSSNQHHQHHLESSNDSSLGGSRGLSLSSQSENLSYLNNVRQARSPREPSSKPTGYGQIGRQAPRITSFTGEIQDASLSALNDQILQVSDDESEESDTQRTDPSLRGQRLGITPFSVQKPEERASPDVMSPMMQRMTGMSASEQSPLNRQRAYSDGTSRSLAHLRGTQPVMDGKPGLSDLRSNTAIIDSSQSDVNVGFNSASFEEPRRGRVPTPRTPRTPSTKNRKFNNLFNLFETRPSEAIVPPDPHWQSGGANTPRSSISRAGTPR